MSILSTLSSKIKSAQSKIEHFLGGKTPTIQQIVEETVLIEDKNKKSTTLEIEGDYSINSKGRLELQNPECPVHGSGYMVKNGWTTNTLYTITGDKIKIVRQMHICKKCHTVVMPGLECLKVPYGRITKDGQRYLLELTIEDGISLRKAKRRLKNTFGLEMNVGRVWYLIQKTGQKCKAFTDDLEIKSSGVICYDEDVLRKIDGNAYKMTLLDAVFTYAIKEEVRDNKQSDTIESFIVEGLKDLPVSTIVTDCDPKYPDIIKNNFPDAQHQYCVGHFNDIIDDDLRKAAGLGYKKKKDLPKQYEKIRRGIYFVFSAKNRSIAEKRLYYLFKHKYGKDSEIDAILMKVKAYFCNLTHFMEDCRIPKTNNILESRYSTTESNYNNNRRFKTLDGANNYSNCQTAFRNYHRIEEGTFVGSSPYSRAGLDHGDNDWLNFMKFGDKLYKHIEAIKKGVLSKLSVT